MKRIALAGIGCSGILCCSAALAQGAVTLYGVADAGLDYVSQVQTGNGGTASRLRAQSSDWGASRFGLLGREDIGGGSEVIFNLESGTNLMAGTAGESNGRLLSRKALVGVRSDRAGTLTFGRNLFIANDQWDMDPLLQQAYSATALVRSRNVPITSNNIEYRSPSWHGFSLHAQYALGNQAGGFNLGAANEYGRSDGIQLTYRNDFVMLRAMYDELRDANGRMSNVFTSSREFFAGANLYWRALTLQAAYTHLNAPDTPAGLARSADHYWAGAQYRATPALTFGGAVYHVRVGSGAGDATHDPSGHATMLALGAAYSLSKRTLLYATVAHVRNASGSNFSVANNNPGTDNDNLANPLPGRSQTGANLGINHSF
ncbi:gram-negative porin family protein [Burkholderia cenocepacia]|uniref:Gram-negative porin family protein n=1 Tax=Burkholderia cenocepacia TaxID=95486 RepID=A0AAN0RS52_9BURK|nr:gram-negative porin family protein [Burkholderia cenocepacia]